MLTGFDMKISRYRNDLKMAKMWIFIVAFIGQVFTSVEANQSPPRFLVEPSDFSSTVNEGGSIRLKCHAVGVPPPKYMWLKDGLNIYENYKSNQFLRIANTAKENAGEYQCIAKNDVGAIISKKGIIKIAYLNPSFDKTNRTVTVKAGSAAILSLPEIDSEPSPAVTWKILSRNEELYGDNKYRITLDKRLVIFDTTPGDSDVYYATIMNELTELRVDSGFIELIVQPAGNLEDVIRPQIVIPPKDTTVIIKSAVDIECITNARPMRNIQTIWMKDGVSIIDSSVSVYPQNNNQKLTLMRVKQDYSGIYECQVKLINTKDPPIRASATVRVEEAARLVSELDQDMNEEIGKTIRMSCPVLGNPTPSLSWYKDAKDIKTALFYGEEKFKYLDDGATLEISNLETNDSGMFQCIASNSAGQASSYTWLHAKITPPVFIKLMKNVTVIDGKDTQIPCKAIGAPPPDTTWKHNDSILTNNAGRVQILEDASLLIASVEPKDTGKYTCVRSNSAGTLTGTIHLSVLVRTQIIQPPSDTKVILSSTATLQCKVSHDPSVPYQIYWFINDKKIDPDRSQRINVLRDGTLEIQEARNTDVGSYTCSVISPGGNETRTARLDVIELPYPPTSVTASLMNTVPKKVKLTWVPAFDGNSNIVKYIVQKRIIPSTGPEPDIMLYWVTALANISAIYTEVILNDLMPATSYQFRISAVNKVGEGNPSLPSSPISLPQEPPSAPPIGVVGSARSATSIMIQWQPPSQENQNGALRGYLIRYKLAGYKISPWASRNISNEAQRNYLLEDLIIWKTYELQMAAYNDMGVGIYSDSIIVRTREGVPQAPPVNVRVSAINSTSIQIWWEPPLAQQINGINQGYKIQAWSLKDGNQRHLEKTIIVPPNMIGVSSEHNAKMADLKKYTSYEISVLCFTNPGDGPRSNYIKVKTHEDVPDKVENMKFKDILDRSVHVLWKAPSSVNGILTGYILTYMVKDNPDTKITKNLTSDTNDVVIGDLKPSTAYGFKLYATTVKGGGAPEMAVIRSGVPPVLPSPPSKLAFSNINPFSVVLQFTPGFDGNTSITKWTVEGQVGKNETWVNIFEVSDPDASTVLVEPLIPFTEYKMRLIATNVVGASNPSEQTKMFQTIQAPPAHPPFNVTVRANSATALRVRWTPLQHMEWHGTPRGYNVSYRRLKDNKKPDGPVEFRTQTDYNSNSFLLDHLDEFLQYEVAMQAFNDVGSSSFSTSAIERTREAKPSAGPKNVNANATTSTTIVVKWGEVANADRNGIIEGYRVYYGAKSVPFMFKAIENNSTFTTTLTELKKYVLYGVQVLAYTRIGNGALSLPPIAVKTFEDVPGRPSNIKFPDVSKTTARIIWDVPEEPNGQILAYRVSYRLNSTTDGAVQKFLDATERTLKVINLRPETYYMFSISAKTSQGWGEIAHVLVYTTNNREVPSPPTSPQVSSSQIQARQITFSWTLGRDGFAPLRYYSIQQAENGGPWKELLLSINPTVTGYTVSNLRPITRYRFKIQATNDIGPSGWSQPSKWATTLQAAPEVYPKDLNIVAITTTSIRVSWQALGENSWNSGPKGRGYKVECCKVINYNLPKTTSCPDHEVHSANTTKLTINKLEKHQNYEVKVYAFNDKGNSPKSPPETVYVGEAVPMGEPLKVQATPISSTAIQLQWAQPHKSLQNGKLHGYKIFYRISGSREEEEMEVVPVMPTQFLLTDLRMYAKYNIQVLAYNPAGDGPRSSQVNITTHEGIPGPPGPLQFSDITMTSLNVSWDLPTSPNGLIRGYLVTYETALHNDSFSKQVKEKVHETHLVVQNLRELVTYTFHVKAETYTHGNESVASVTTGPQDGSPKPVRNLVSDLTASSAALSWTNGKQGDSDIIGYIIESKKMDDDRWEALVVLSYGPLNGYTVSFQNLLPSTNYQFRVISRNKNGISLPTELARLISTPVKFLPYRHKLPFYREVWFLVTLAAISLVIIIMVIAILCVKSKSYKYKQEAQQKSIQDERMSIDDGGFATFELRQSKRGTLRKNTLSRKSGASRIAKSPPRPSPGSVTYSDDEDTKGYDDNCDSSSLTEKPSEISSTDSQATESDADSEPKADPHSFVNHYANVNDTFRQSWKRQRPARIPSYTDSEHEGSISMSLNGGQIVMNNMAGSRAPLPGFSSFV